MYSAAMAEDAGAGFTEKAFFEYHLYTLGRRTDLADSSTKQLQLMPTARGIECAKELVFAPTLANRYWGYQQLDRDYGRYGKAEVNVFLRFRNAEAQQLGVPLPAGRIRVMQLDPADDSLEFIGEDVLDHTPRNEDSATTRIQRRRSWCSKTSIGRPTGKSRMRPTSTRRKAAIVFVST
jgi:hypothetical protein